VSAAVDRSRALPPRPSVSGTIKAALSDFYFNSIRLVAANVVWGIGFVVVMALAVSAPLVAIPAAILLALPTAGVFRLAALIARDEPASVSDAFDVWRGREHALPVLAAGALMVGALIVLGFNFAVGVLSSQPFWLLIGTLAGWGLVFLFIGIGAFWPLLMDPLRRGEPLKRRLWLSLGVVFYQPLRYLGLCLICAAILIVSTIAFAALLSISLAFVALLLCRYVLPTADRLEGRATYAEPILD
jgi:uncharacterized membrane protein YesL